MCDALVHRGPDDVGIHVAEGVGLGMRRLSIIDLAGGHQPIENEDGRCRIVFNGEIYNYRELSAELRSRGHQFRTRSDTETILHRYEEVGEGCAHSLNGMFAFAIWDEGRRELLLCRDRLGVKPLYYWFDGSELVFGSEIKALVASGRLGDGFDPESLWHFLTYRYVPAPRTMWRGVRKLPPGHWLRYSPDTQRLEVEPYWDLRFPERAEPRSIEEDLEHFSALLADSVQRRLIADVPVGILLSGGLDSSAVAAAVAEVHNTRLSTFSVGFADPHAFDELGFAREVAQHLGTDHHEVVLTLDDFIAFLPEMVWYTDEPLADPAAVPLYHVSRLASKHVKVVLSGEGADEVLGGYDFNRSVAWWDRQARYERLPGWLRAAVRAPAPLVQRFRPDVAARLRRFGTSVADQNRAQVPHITDYFDSAEKRALLNGFPELPDSKEFLRTLYSRSDTSDPLHQALYVYCKDWLVEDLLMKADRMTMATSIELRVPFLDYRLVEWLATVPSDRKVRRVDGSYQTKYLLRRFAEGRVPSSILDRPKQGFPVPVAHWMAGALGDFAREMLGAGDARLGQFLRREALDPLVAAGTRPGNTVASTKLWLLLVAELWARRWMPGAGGEAFRLRDRTMESRETKRATAPAGRTRVRP